MTNKRTQVLVNFITAFGLIYTCSGGAQVIGGIYFIFILPTFETWSNIWTGLWGVVCGVTTILLSCFGGGLTSGRAQAILLMSISVGCCNAINMLVMEIGEWRIFDGGDGGGHHHGHHQHHQHDNHYPSSTEDLGQISSSFGTYAGGGVGQFGTPSFGEGPSGYLVNDTVVFVNGTPSYAALREPTVNYRKDTMTHQSMDPDPFTAEVLKNLLSYAYLTTTISTAAALVSSFIASQYILCFMYRNEKNKQAGHPDAFRSTTRNAEDEPPGLSSPWLQRHEAYQHQYAMWMDKLYVEQHQGRFTNFLLGRNRQNSHGDNMAPDRTGGGTHRSRTRAVGDGADGGGRKPSRLSSSNQTGSLFLAGAVMDDDGGLRYGASRRPSYINHERQQQKHNNRLSRSNSFSSTTTLGSQYSSIHSLGQPASFLARSNNEQQTSSAGVDGEPGKSTQEKSASRSSTLKQREHLEIDVGLANANDPDYVNLKRLHDAYYGTKLTQGLPGVPGLGPSLASTKSSSSDSSSLHSSPSGYLHQAINSLYIGSTSGRSSSTLHDSLRQNDRDVSLAPDGRPRGKKIAARTSSTGGHSNRSNASSSKRRYHHRETPEPIPPNIPQDRLFLVPAEQLQPSSSSSGSSSSANSSVSGTYSQQQLASATGSTTSKKSSRKTFSCPRDLRSLPTIPDFESNDRKISSDSSDTRRGSSAVLRRQSTQETSFSVDSYRADDDVHEAVITIGDDDGEVEYEAIREMEI